MNENILYLAICSLVIGANFELENGVIVKWKSEIKQPTKTQIANKVKELEAKALTDAKNEAIELHIYANYSQKTQAQDNGWVSNFTTKLVAGGVTDLESQIVEFTTSFLTGIKLDEVLADVDDAVKPMFEKLVKVAVKNEWAYLVIQEGKLAIAENREPVYAEFPKFD